MACTRDVQLIGIGQEFYVVRNYHGVTEIISILKNTAVKRLKHVRVARIYT